MGELAGGLEFPQAEGSGECCGIDLGGRLERGGLPDAGPHAAAGATLEEDLAARVGENGGGAVDRLARGLGLGPRDLVLLVAGACGAVFADGAGLSLIHI